MNVQDKQHAGSYLRDLVESLNEIWLILSRLAIWNGSGSGETAYFQLGCQAVLAAGGLVVQA